MPKPAAFPCMAYQIIILVFALLLPLLCWGEEEKDSPKLTTLETIVIKAAKTDNSFETGDVDLEQTPGFFTIINREAFEGKMSDLSEVIEKEAGIQVRQTGGMGSFSSVSLRGSTSEQVMIYLDGILLNDASGGGVDLSNISLSDVASIEIFQGNTPIQFGKASIGGVINIKTLRPENGINGHASCGYGAFNTKKASAMVNYTKNKLSVLVSAELMDTDGDFEFNNTNGTLWTTEDDEWEDRENAQVEQYNVLGKIGYRLGDSGRIDFMNQWFKKNQGVPNWKNSSRNNASLDSQRNISTLKLTMDNLTDLHINTATTLELSRLEEEYKDLQGYVGLGKQHDLNTTTKYGISSYAEMLTAHNTFIFSVDIKHETYEPEDLIDTSGDGDSDRTTGIIGTEDTLFLLNDRLSITPAVRFMAVDSNFNTSSSSSLTSTSTQENNSDDFYCSPQLGARYQLFSAITLKSNIARYVREPSLYELFGDRGFFLGNSELEAEKGTNVDAGLEGNFTVPSDLVSDCSFSFVYFHSKVDNIITRVYDARGVGKAQNIASSTISGVETKMSSHFLKYFTFSCSMTWQDTNNESDVSAFKNKKLPGRYEKSFMARLEVKWWKIKAYTEYLTDKGMYYDSANLLEAPDKETINIGASVLLSETLSLLAEVTNIQDNHYEDFYRYPLPGMAWYFSVKYMF